MQLSVCKDMKKTKNANKESNTFRHFFKKIVAFTIFFPYSFLFRIKMCNFAKLLEKY